MVGPEHDPSAEHKSTVDDQSAEKKTENERKGSLDGDEEELNTTARRRTESGRWTYVVLAKEMTDNEG